MGHFVRLEERFFLSVSFWNKKCRHAQKLPSAIFLVRKIKGYPKYLAHVS